MKLLDLTLIFNLKMREYTLRQRSICAPNSNDRSIPPLKSLPNWGALSSPDET